MSEITEEPLEAAPTSGEETEQQREGEPADTPTARKGRGRIPDLSEIVEGKRTKKTVERLEFQISIPKEKLKVEDGGGDKLGEIPRTNHMIGKLKPGDLKPLHAIMFDRPGKTVSMRKNMRQFNGFLFDVNSEQFTKKRDKLLRTTSLTNSKLRVICKVLDLEQKGTQADLVERILTFLIAPKNSGKPLLSKKKKRSKKKLSGSDSKAKTKSKPRPKSTSASPKKTKTGSKSKAIVMDSSSDDDDDEDEDEKTGAQAEEEEAKESGNEQEKSDESGEEEEDDDDDGDEKEEAEEEDDDEEEEEEDDSPKSKVPTRKPVAGKRPRAPTKKSPMPRKRAKKVLSESDSDSEADKKPKKKAAAKKTTPAKPAAKTKKADSSSSNSKKTTVSELCPKSEESSDDDRPLIKMVRPSAPSDEQLKETVKSLLADTDLEEITMKQICQRVYDAYPDHDLTSRKDYIKQTVKSLIT